MLSLLVPCYNEEKSIEKSIHSWLKQTRPFDEIIVIDDSSTDATPQILARYSDRIRIVKTPQNSGNKSYAQEYGLQFVRGEVFAVTDADTVLQEDFAEHIERNFVDPDVAAVGGYVKSLKYNWLTRYRAFEYSIGQNFHKLAQSYMDYLFVIPGAAGAFRTDVFREHLTFDHDTITEDLDFTYKLHKLGYKIMYDREAIALTQDPATLRSYVNQMRRWCAGGWQNLLKHRDIALRPRQALELSLMYIEGLSFSVLLLLVPFINLRLVLIFTIPYFFLSFAMSVFVSCKERRPDLLLAPFSHMFMVYVNAFVLVEQFVKEVLLRRKLLIWFKPDRVSDI